MTEVSPLVGPPPQEVALPRAPLHRVIAQVRFPMVAAIEQREFIAPFQEAIRERYPVLRLEQAQNIVIAPVGVAPLKSQPAWRFAEVDQSWRVSLTPEFLALETTAYTSRSDFLARLRQALGALEKHVKPSLADRLGVRYIDRITGGAIANIAGLVRPEVRGIAGTPLEGQALHSLTESLLAVGEARLLARWGKLPPSGTVDPGAIEPIGEDSWILDLDMFTAEPRPFDVDQIVNEAQRFAERLYTVFRWAVTDEFLRLYGGEI
jgi:uncharacterized protein (TIGR04255 family)